jgi:RNA polymerase sigma-70 factor, ECF subfamily
MSPRPEPATFSRGAPEPLPRRRGEPDEATLLRAARGGDRDAFDRLAVRLLPRLLGTARRILGDPLEAEEAVAATLVRAHAALAGFRGASALGTWAHRILCRLATDRLRRIARVRRHERPLADDIARGSGDDALDTASRKEESLRVRAAVEALPETQRLVLVLVLWEGLSLAEAARVLAMRYATVKSNLHHARATLRRRLDATDAGTDAGARA